MGSFLRGKPDRDGLACGDVCLSTGAFVGFAMSGVQKTSILAQILAEFDRQRHPLSSRELASTFGKDIAVVEGMLETLVRSGRLMELGRDGLCEQCPAQSLCIIIPLKGRRFCLVPNEGWELPDEHGTCGNARDRDRA